jgi:hypothetical protein
LIERRIKHIKPRPRFDPAQSYVNAAALFFLVEVHSTCTMKETFMRIMALVLASALAVCFVDVASAATKRSAEVANPDKSVYPNSRGCTTYCYRSGRQKIQIQKPNH